MQSDVQLDVQSDVQSDVQLDHAGEEDDAEVILISGVTSDLNGRGIDRGLI